MGFLPVQKSVYLAIVVMLGVHFLPTPPPLDALRKVGTRTDRVLLGFLMVGAGLSMWIRERVSQGEDPIESTSMRRLIVTADDFGLSPGVNAGIVEAHERGIVTATSLMVNAPAAREALHWASEHRSLAVGLHFVLTFARPVGPTEPLEELVDENGRFRRLETGVHERASAGDVREEIRAQLARFADAVGRAPSHIDGHHHVHALPGDLHGEAKPRCDGIRTEGVALP